MTADIHHILRDSEDIQWQGKPLRLIITFSEIVSLFMGLFCMTMAFIMLILSRKLGNALSLFEVIFCIVFACLAFGFTFGVQLSKIYIISRSRFYITNQRVIFNIQTLHPQTRVVELDSITMIEKKSISGSAGHIIFCARGPQSQPQSTYNDNFSAFYMIKDVDDVYRLLYRAMRNQRNTAEQF